MIKEFKEFILKGNLVEVAVGLILALAVKDVVDSLVEHVITPIVAAVGGEPSFDALVLNIGDGEIRYGLFLNALVSLLIVGFILFLIVKAYNRLSEMAKRGGTEEEAAADSDDVALLREIRDLLAQGNGPQITKN